MSAGVLHVDWVAVAIECHGNVELMAAKAFLSRRTLERYFQSHFGLPPSQWAKMVLLNHTVELLKHGYSNKAIVLELHLCSESWFCREFKRRFGVTPHQFFVSQHARCRAQNILAHPEQTSS